MSILNKLLKNKEEDLLKNSLLIKEEYLISIMEEVHLYSHEKLLEDKVNHPFNLYNQSHHLRLFNSKTLLPSIKSIPMVKLTY